MKQPSILKIRTEPEEIVRIDHIAAAYNADKMLRDRKFLVDLACGHKTYTSAQKKAICPRCSEMLRRSIADGREDYESFRKGILKDQMVWRNDPCRQFNERANLAGEYIDEPVP